MALKIDVLKKMVRAILTTTDDEIDCGECFQELDTFIDLRLQGKNAAEAMPLVEAHLNRCMNCREEFEALLDALKATA